MTLDDYEYLISEISRLEYVIEQLKADIERYLDEIYEVLPDKNNG